MFWSTFTHFSVYRLIIHIVYTIVSASSINGIFFCNSFLMYFRIFSWSIGLWSHIRHKRTVFRKLEKIVRVLFLSFLFVNYEILICFNSCDFRSKGCSSTWLFTKLFWKFFCYGSLICITNPHSERVSNFLGQNSFLCCFINFICLFF